MIVLQSPQGRFHWHRYSRRLTFTPKGRRRPSLAWSIGTEATERGMTRLAAAKLMAMLEAAK